MSNELKLTKIYNRSIIKKLKKGKNRTNHKLPKRGEEKWTTKK